MKIGRSLFLTLLLTLSIVAVSQSAIITDPLPFGTYITIGDLDWTWASPVNAQNWFDLNELMAPSFHIGWRYASQFELDNLLPSLADFTNIDGTYIQSVQYWNTNFTHVDPGDYASGFVSSAWTGSFNETVYVRNVVPEPSTFLLLGGGLAGLAFVVRRRKQE